MSNFDAPDCTNRSSTHPEKGFNGLPSIYKKSMTCGWQKLIKNHFKKNYLSAQTTL